MKASAAASLHARWLAARTRKSLPAANSFQSFPLSFLVQIMRVAAFRMTSHLNAVAIDPIIALVENQ
jgi:hypothetical protein